LRILFISQRSFSSDDAFRFFLKVSSMNVFPRVVGLRSLQALSFIGLGGLIPLSSGLQETLVFRSRVFHMLQLRALYLFSEEHSHSSPFPLRERLSVLRTLPQCNTSRKLYCGGATPQWKSSLSHFTAHSYEFFTACPML